MKSLLQSLEIFLNTHATMSRHVLWGISDDRFRSSFSSYCYDHYHRSIILIQLLLLHYYYITILLLPLLLLVLTSCVEILIRMLFSFSIFASASISKNQPPFRSVPFFFFLRRRLTWAAPRELLVARNCCRTSSDNISAIAAASVVLDIVVDREDGTAADFLDLGFAFENAGNSAARVGATVACIVVVVVLVVVVLCLFFFVIVKCCFCFCFCCCCCGFLVFFFIVL